jgi:hypothetical protein
MKFIIIISFISFCTDATAQKKVIPIKSGESAPFAGLLVPEEKFVEFMENDNALSLISAKHKALQEYAKQLEIVYDEHMKLAFQKKWYENTTLNVVFGAIIGITMTCLAITVGVKIVEANR